MESTGTGGRKKLEPDPRVRIALLAAASKIVQESGVGALSIALVLTRAKLSTRAFYRHFDSKDQLVSELFLEMARVEMLRLRQKMLTAPDPIRAVAFWIDGRLDLAFNDQLRSDLRRMSVEAQSQMFAAPELVGRAYGEILRPLIEQLERGRDLELFTDVGVQAAVYDEALSIHGVVWSHVEQQWATGSCDLAKLRTHLLRFCLRGLGVAPQTITAVIAELLSASAERQEELSDNASSRMRSNK